MVAPRRLGILGGMGPLATVDLIEKIVRLTPAVTDQQHLPLVVWSDPRVPPRSAAVLGAGESPLPALWQGMRALEAAGAEGVAIACNTAHHWFDQLRSGSPLELIHIADTVAAALAMRPQPAPRVGLLATAGSVASGFYQVRLGELGHRVQPPDAEQQRRVQAGIDAVKAGRPEAGTEDLGGVAQALLDAGADVVLLACTEIPLALRGAPEPLRAACLDATEALARGAIAWSLGTAHSAADSRAAASSRRASG